MQLPSNYNFEVRKTVWKVKEAEAKCVALQFPEGLLMFACTIADIVERFTGASTIIMGDVTYGACCVDDLGAAALGADFMVHYGHSCLVPIDVTGQSLKMLYVFVDITFDPSHVRLGCEYMCSQPDRIAPSFLALAQLVETVRANFAPGSKLAVLGTIQFASVIHSAQSDLEKDFPGVFIPQAKPLSPGEVLGCTSPKLPSNLDAYIFVADGRFHLEVSTSGAAEVRGGENSHRV